MWFEVRSEYHNVLASLAFEMGVEYTTGCLYVKFVVKFYTYYQILQLVSYDTISRRNIKSKLT